MIGLSLCMKNLTGKYPEFLLMKGTGFAIHGMGNSYLMVKTGAIVVSVMFASTVE